MDIIAVKIVGMKPLLLRMTSSVLVPSADSGRSGFKMLNLENHQANKGYTRAEP
jgi:hypothetical protein